MFSIKRIACIAIPSFAIAVERIREPRLRGRPVVVAQSRSPRSRCLSVSREAIGYGVRNGQLVSQALRACRDLVVVEPKPEIYNDARSAITSIISAYSPLVEPALSGRHFLDLTGTTRLFGNPANIALAIQKEINEALTLPADAGIATNKLVSRVASIDADSSEIVEVPGGCEDDYLAPHRVEVLPVVRGEIRRQLSDLNIQSVEHVRDLSLDQLLSALGPPAFLLSRQSYGIDPAPVTPPTREPRLVLQKELPEDSNCLETIEKAAHDLALDAALSLMTSPHEPSNLTLTLTYSDGKRVSFGRSLQVRLQNAVELLDIVVLLLRGHDRRIRVRSVELNIEMRKSTASQQSLWASESFESARVSRPLMKCTEQQSRKCEQLLGAISLIRTRFGKSAVAWGA